MKELNFNAKVENVVTLASGTTVVKLKSDEEGAPAELGLTFPEQLIFETGEYEVSLRKVVPPTEPEAVEPEETE